MCNCIKDYNNNKLQKLYSDESKSSSVKIKTVSIGRVETITVPVEQSTKNKGPKIFAFIAASFCPFCGEKLLNNNTKAKP